VRNLVPPRRIVVGMNQEAKAQSRALRWSQRLPIALIGGLGRNRRLDARPPRASRILHPWRGAATQEPRLPRREHRPRNGKPPGAALARRENRNTESAARVDVVDVQPGCTGLRAFERFDQGHPVDSTASLLAGAARSAALTHQLAVHIASIGQPAPGARRCAWLSTTYTSSWSDVSTPSSGWAPEAPRRRRRTCDGLDQQTRPAVAGDDPPAGVLVCGARRLGRVSKGA